MFMNLDTLPPGKAMFTLYVGLPGRPPEEADEYDQVAPARREGLSYLTSLVIEAAAAELTRLYGPEVEVIGIVNQSEGYTLFDSRNQGCRPIPVVPPAPLVAYERPYDTLLSLFDDNRNGHDSDPYLDFLLKREG